MTGADFVRIPELRTSDDPLHMQLVTLVTVADRLGLAKAHDHFIGVIARAIEAECDRLNGVERCEHGIADGEYCQPCNAAYKAARDDPENGISPYDWE